MIQSTKDKIPPISEEILCICIASEQTYKSSWIGRIVHSVGIRCAYRIAKMVLSSAFYWSPIGHFKLNSFFLIFFFLYSYKFGLCCCVLGVLMVQIKKIHHSSWAIVFRRKTIQIPMTWILAMKILAKRVNWVQAAGHRFQPFGVHDHNQRSIRGGPCHGHLKMASLWFEFNHQAHTGKTIDITNIIMIIITLVFNNSPEFFPD